MELRKEIYPSTLVMLHMQTDPLPALKVGETVLYDYLHKDTIEDLETFKNFLSRFYEYKHIFGSEESSSYCLYEITAVKPA